MSADIQIIGLASACIAALAFVTEWSSRVGLVPQWLSRKILHIFAVGSCALVPFWLEDLQLLLVLVGMAELLLLWLVGTGRLFREVNGRRSWGIALFPLAYLVLLWFLGDQKMLIAVPMLVLAFADAAAAIVGNTMARKYYTLTGDRKSWQGNLAFTMVAAVVLWCGIANGQPGFAPPVFFPGLIIVCLAMGAYLAAVEAIGSTGLDNLYIPLVAALLLASWQQKQFSAEEALTFWALGLAAGVVFVVLTIRRKSLTPAGSVVAVLLGLMVAWVAGPVWLLPLFAFFLSSSLLGRLVGARVKSADAKHGKARDAVQVLSNGGAFLAAACLMLVPVQQDAAMVAMAVSMSVAIADTWSSEIGQAARGATFDVLRLRRVPPGLSGGVSLMGTLGGMAGATGMAMLCLWLPGVSGSTFWIVLVSGVVGMMLDSVLGAAFQVRYKSREDGSLQDSPYRGAEYAGGLSWMSNDLVNLLSNAFTTFMVYFLLVC